MTKTDRTRLKIDTPIVGEGPAMMSRSGKKINLHDVLYTAVVAFPSGGHRFQKQLDEYDDEDDLTLIADAEAHRVIQVNYQDRYIRIRSVDGCEETIPFADGACPRRQMFHTFDEVQKLVLNGCQREMRSISKEISQRHEYRERVAGTLNTVTAMMGLIGKSIPPQEGGTGDDIDG